MEEWYIKCFARVRWINSLSDPIKLNAGVRQGGILSPMMFSIYVDCVLKELKDSQLGYHIREMCLNAIMYADDLILLSISVSELKALIEICQLKFNDLDMPINVSKCSCCRFGSRFKCTCSKIELAHAEVIPWFLN